MIRQRRQLDFVGVTGSTDTSITQSLLSRAYFRSPSSSHLLKLLQNILFICNLTGHTYSIVHFLASL